MSATKAKNYDLASSDDMLQLAKELGKFIKENKLYQNVQGKEYVNVEGWQFAGSMLGITSVVKEVTNISNDLEIKYAAKVELFKLGYVAKVAPDSAIYVGPELVGAGVAICSNKEQGKKYYQEFAIASMAQTRAVGKAYRAVVAFLIRAAGYEPTPAEEMDYSGNTSTEAQPVKVEAERPKVEANPVHEQIKNDPHEVPKLGEPEKLPVKKEKEPAPDAAKAAQVEKAAPEITPPAEPAANIKYASARQKEEIIRLLNNPVITRQEKTKMLLNINKLDEARAEQAATKLRKVIQDREDEQAAAA
jgi:hypothetical protein